MVINQRKELQPLGVFNFEAGETGSLTVSSKDADGFVVVDAVELTPVASVKEITERRFQTAAP